MLKYHFEVEESKVHKFLAANNTQEVILFCTYMRSYIQL
jgi:hypothetical protein